jgi:hypothetical protein
MIRFVSWECDAADVIPTVTLNVLSGDVDLIGEIKELLEDGPK